MATYTVNITYNLPASGTLKIGSADANGNVQEEGVTVTILAIPFSGFSFVSYVIDGGSPILTKSYSFVMPASDVNITVNFEAIAVPTNTEQADLYDTACPKFFFIQDLSDRFFTGDLVNLTSYNPTELIEPIGFDTGKFKLERDDTYHGFNYEFGIDSMSYERGTVGYDYLKEKLLVSGTDSDIKFLYGFGQPEAFTVFYLGKVDMNEYQETSNGDYVEFSLVELDFDNLLQTAFEVPQLVELTVPTRLYSKVIPKRVQYQIEIPEDALGIGLGLASMAWFAEAFRTPDLPNPDIEAINKTTGAAFVYFNDGREGDSDFETFATYDFQADSENPVEARKFIFSATESGLYTVDVKFWMGLNFVSPANFVDFGFLRLVWLVRDPVTNAITQTSSYVANEIITPTGLIDPDKIASFEQNFDLNIEVGYEFYMFVGIYVDEATFPVVGSVSSIVAYPFQYDYNIPQIAVLGQTVELDSDANTSTVFDMVNSACKQATEADYTILKSDFFGGSGCGSLMYLTNGFNVRGLTNRNASVAPKKLIDMLSKLYCLGWGVEYNELKQELIALEPVEYFYQDVEIMSFDSVSDYTKAIDTQKYYNEIEVGFSKYSKQRETNKGFTLDDFHTKHTYQTPIKTNKNKLSIITDLILSAYEIEILRRKQFLKDGEKASSSYNEDEDIFGIQLTSALATDDFDYPNDKILNEEGILTVISGQYPLTLVIGDEVDYTSRAGVLQTRTVVSFFVDSYTILDTVVTTTYIGFAEALTGAVTGGGDVAVSRVSAGGFLTTEGAQPFETVENLLSPSTSFNLRHSPKRMLYNWAKLINGGFFTKSNSDEIIFKQGDGNVELTTKFKITESCLLGDSGRDSVYEAGNVAIDEFDGRSALFLPIKISFSTSLSFEQLTDLKKCLRGQDGVRDYGYITVQNYCGVDEKIYITSIEYSPVTEEAQIEGYLKQL
jgi:hypothetical protein